MSAPIEKNAQENNPLNSNTLRGVRHILAGITALRHVENPSAADLQWARLIAGQLDLTRMMMEARAERAEEVQP